MRFLVLGYEISRCADLVGRGSVAEKKDWSDGREMGHTINIETCQKANVDGSLERAKSACGVDACRSTNTVIPYCSVGRHGQTSENFLVFWLFVPTHCVKL